MGPRLFSEEGLAYVPPAPASRTLNGLGFLPRRKQLSCLDHPLAASMGPGFLARKVDEADVQQLKPLLQWGLGFLAEEGAPVRRQSCQDRSRLQWGLGFLAEEGN